MQAGKALASLHTCTQLLLLYDTISTKILCLAPKMSMSPLRRCELIYSQSLVWILLALASPPPREWEERVILFLIWIPLALALSVGIAFCLHYTLNRSYK